MYLEMTFAHIVEHARDELPPVERSPILVTRTRGPCTSQHVCESGCQWETLKPCGFTVTVTITKGTTRTDMERL